MRVRGALHVHSRLSHDGTLTVAEVADFYRAKGYHFVAMGEHSQDMAEEEVQELVRDCARNSGEDFCLIPGIEFTCRKGVHVLGAGCVALTQESEPAAVARHVRAHGGFAVVAHPSRYQWECSSDLLQAVDAIEIWNLAYDGKFLPGAQALRVFAEIRKVNPGLLAVAGHDLHRVAGFYDVSVEMEVNRLCPEAVLENLHNAAYCIRSRFFSSSPHGSFSPWNVFVLRLLSRQLGRLRSARDLVVRWSQ